MNKEKAIDNALANIDSDFIKALSEPARLAIIKLLILHGTLDATSLAEKMPQDRSVISRHLSMMEKSGLLSSTKEGRHVFYTLDAKSALVKAEKLVDSFRQCCQAGCC
jgi:DNA-binding transcriptional ArsR family regulator